MVMLLAGVGLWADDLWFVCLAALAVVLLTWGVISREEAYLEGKLGSAYASSRARARRWL